MREDKQCGTGRCSMQFLPFWARALHFVSTQPRRLAIMQGIYTIDLSCSSWQVVQLQASHDEREDARASHTHLNLRGL